MKRNGTERNAIGVNKSIVLAINDRSYYTQRMTCASFRLDIFAIDSINQPGPSVHFAKSM